MWALKDWLNQPIIRQVQVDASRRLVGCRQGAQLSMADYDGRTALHIACCEGHVDAVRYLLDLGAPVHVRDRYGDTPLDEAVMFHRPGVVQMLRQTGAHLTIPPAKLVVAVNKLVVTYAQLARARESGRAYSAPLDSLAGCKGAYF